MAAEKEKAKRKQGPSLSKPPVEYVVPKDLVNWGSVVAPLAAILFVTLVVDFQGLFGAFLFNDQNNFSLASLVQTSPETFWLQLWTEGVLHPLAQPWTLSTFALDIKSLGWQPVFCHFVNLILHLAACAYLYALVFRLSWRFKQEKRFDLNPYIVSFAVTLLFALHPLTVGVVAYVSGRSAALLASSYLLSLDCFIMGFLSQAVPVALFFYILCFGFMGLALFSNPQAVTIPSTIILIAFLLRDPAEPWKEWFQERWYELALFAIPAICLPLVLLQEAPKLIDNGIGLGVLPAAAYFASELKVMVTYYLRGLIAPFGLTVDPPMVVAQGFSDPLALLGAAAVIACLALIWFVRKRPLMVLGLSIFLVGFVPASFMPQSELVAAHRIYLSLAGACIVLGCAFAALFNKPGNLGKIALGATAAYLAAINIWCTLDYRNDIELWRAAVRVNPESDRAHAMLARAVSAKNNPQEAKAEAAQALKLSPDQSMAYIVLGDEFTADKKYKEAAEQYKKALDSARKQGLSSQEIAVYESKLAQTYAKLDNWKEAKVLAENALQILKADTKLHLIIGQSLLKEKQWYQAYLQLKEGKRTDPYNQEYLEPIAEAALNSGLGALTQEAYAYARQAATVTLTSKAALLYGRAALEMGKVGEAVKVITRVVQIDHGNPEGIYLLSVAYKMAGQQAQSDQLKKLALKMNPNIVKEVPIYLGKQASEKELQDLPHDPDAVQQPN